MKDGVVVSGANSNMLRITNIEESDEGVYKCVVSNKGGQVESNPATIVVYGEYVLLTMLHKLTLNFNCYYIHNNNKQEIYFPRIHSLTFLEKIGIFM